MVGLHNGWTWGPVVALLALHLGGAHAFAQDCDPAPDPQNLIYNGHFECEGFDPSVPDGWERFGATSTTDAIWMPTGAAPTGGNHDGSRVLKIVSDVADTFTASWRLRNNLVNLEPDTWYEFSLDIASAGAELSMLPPDDPVQPDGAARSSYWNNMQVDLRYDTNGENQRIQLFSLGATGIGVMDDFDAGAGVYRSHKTGDYEPWRRMTRVFRTKHWSPEDVVFAEIKTAHFPVGTIYFDNVVLKKTQPNVDTSVPPKLGSGALHFLQHAGADFFPIVIWGNPYDNGVQVFPDDFATWRSLLGAGFNTSGYSSAAQSNQRAVLESWPAALKFVFPFGNPYWMSAGGPGGGPSVLWRDDPGHLYPWDTPLDLQDMLDFLKSLGTPPAPLNTAARDNLLFTLTRDEETCHPAEWGAPLGQLDILTFPRNQLHAPENFPDVPVISDFCGGAGSAGGLYTGAPADLIPYLEVTDVFTQTANLPAAYPGHPTTHPDVILDILGAGIRRSIEYAAVASAGGPPKPQLAYGLGVREWATWDGDTANTPADDSHPADQYIPYNLQRFLVYTQLINGATGVWFHVSHHMDVADTRDAVFLDQVRHLSEEIAGLQDVFLVPTYDNTPVTVSDSHIGYMLKSYAGKRYLFTASSYPQDLTGVQFTLSSQIVTKVTALGDVINGDYANPVDEVICEGACNTFTDDFIGEDGTAGQYLPTPGYAVHVYEMEVIPDHFKCYRAKDLRKPKFVSTTVNLVDQFPNDGPFEVKKPFLMCNPTDKNGEGIGNPDDHLTCYKIKGPRLDKALRPKIEVLNQLGTLQLEVKKPFLLCVPSAKTVLP